MPFVADELVIPLRKQGEIGFGCFAPREFHISSNDSATRPAGRVDGNRSAMAGLWGMVSGLDSISLMSSLSERLSDA